MGDQLQVLQATVDRLERRVNEFSVDGGDQTTALGATSPIDFQPVPTEPPKPGADQQLRNGDGSHSVNTWKDAVAAPGTDKVLECAYFFSSAGPAATGQVLDVTTDSETTSTNDTLKAVGHSTYDGTRCDWDATHGVIRLTGLSTLNALLPGNPVFPGRTEYFGCRMARRNSTIVITSDTRIAAMLYNNTPASEDFMQAGVAFHVSGGVRGNPVSTTQRKYKVLAKTDRGYTFLSDELDLPDAPDDASFGSNVDVFLEWDRLDGILSYDVYRHDITAGKYRLLKTITSGANTFGDNNSINNSDTGGYPVSTTDRVRCYVATLTDALASVAIDGVSAEWDDLFLNIPVPAPLLSAASGKQVFRLALTAAMDREMTDVVSTAGSASISSATAEFSTLDTGRSATLTDSSGNILHGPDSITYVDATHVNFSTVVSTNNVDATLYIVGGGDHGLLVDLLHLSYVEKAKYSSWPEDRTRTLSPTAAPNTSNQGGIGTGGDTGDPGDGGIGGCIPMDCPTWVYEGNRPRSVPFAALRRGFAMLSGGVSPNFTKDLLISETDNLHIVKFQNGIVLPSSPGQPLFTSRMDTRGTAVHRLRAGDRALTVRDGRVELSRIVSILATNKRVKVGTPSLVPGHSYLAGYLSLPWYETVWRWLYRKDRGPSAAILHNVKNRDDQFNVI